MGLFPLPLLSVKRAMWHKLTGEQDGEEVLLLAQLRSRLETSSKRIPPDKRILFPTPHSLPCSPVGGTDVPSSQYSWDGMVLSTKNRRKEGWEGRWRKILMRHCGKGRQDAGVVGGITMQHEVSEQRLQAHHVKAGHLLININQAEIAEQSD